MPSKHRIIKTECVGDQTPVLGSVFIWRHAVKEERGSWKWGVKKIPF